MDELLSDFENLKVSAFSKLSKLSGDINNVTIGPNSTISELSNVQSDPRSEKKKPNKVTFAQENIDTTNIPPLTQILKEYEIERREKVQDVIHDRYQKFEDFTKTRNKQDEWLHNQQAFIRSVREHEESIIRAINQPDVNKQRTNDDLVKHYQELIQRKMQYEQKLEKNKEKQKIRNEQFDKIKKCHIMFTTIYQEIVAQIKATTLKIQWKKTLGDDYVVLLKTLPESFDKIISDCKAGKVDENLVKKAESVLNDTKQFKIQVDSIISKIADTKKEEVQVKPQPVPKSVQVAPTTADNEQCVSATNLKRYLEVRQFLAQHSNLFKELLADEQMKQFRFDCKKAINIPTNAISAVNPQHLTDKYVKLYDLLAGKTVSVADKQINAARHPQGVSFCMDLLAKKFVLQGDLMISSKPEAAFCYATVIVSLWNDFPTFGKLLLGHFYTECSYLVPFYIPKSSQRTSQDYYLSLGYRYVDGQIEKQDKFLKRLSGILRLYFAIFIARPKRGQTKHPHDIKNAWTYLSSLLRIEPQLDITATTLYVFLETIGFEMEIVFGRAFKKLVRIIIEVFLPALKQIDSGGPVNRLELLLQEYKKNGCFEKPDGILSNNFW